MRHRALQFIGRGLRIGRGDGGEGGEPVGVRAHRLGQAIVGDARQRHRGRRIHLLQSGIGVRQHLHVDPRLVHLLDAEAGQVVQPLRDGGKLPLILGRIRTRHVGVLVVFLDGDHARLCGHGGLPVRPDFCHSGGCLPSGCARCNRWHAGPFKITMTPAKFLAVLPFLGILLGPVFS